jgi:Flp pilus assembly protein TadG
MRIRYIATSLTSRTGPKSRRPEARQGAAIIEFAVVAPVTFLLVLGLIVGGLGVFRYQEVAHLAREATRYASTHGGDYQLDGLPTSTGVPSVISNAEIQAYLAGKTVALDSTKLTVNASWSAPSSIVPLNLPTYLLVDPNVPPSQQKVERNYVSVTVTYQWMPEGFVIGPINLTSTSKIAVSY